MFLFSQLVEESFKFTSIDYTSVAVDEFVADLLYWSK